MFATRQLQIAFKTTCLQRLGHSYSYQTHVHPIRVRAFASTLRAEVTEHPTYKDSPLFQQLATNPSVLLALKEFGQFMKEQGLPTLPLKKAKRIEFSPDRPPSTTQLFRLMVNPTFRKSVQKLREDLANAGVDVDPENAMEMLKAFKGQDANSK